MEQLIKKLIERNEKLSKDRSNVETIWQDIGDYFVPHTVNIVRKESTISNKNTRTNFTDVGIKAAEYLASSMHGGATSPVMKWFNLGLKQQDNIQGQLGKFLEIARDRMLDVFNSSSSGFPLQTHEFLLSLVTYGTACMLVEDAIEEGIQFTTVHVSEIFISENKYGKVDTVFRKNKMTARQMMQKWGDKNHEKTKKTYEKDPDAKIEVLHVCMPKDEIAMPTNKAHEYVSFYIDVANKHLLSKGGYYECPYIVTRFSKISGEVYGRSPAWHSLATVRMLNKMEETLIKSAQMQASPPLLVADDGVMMPLRAVPNGIIAGGISYDGTQRVAPLNIGGQLVIGVEMLRDKEQQVKEAFFMDKLSLRDGPAMTATEVMQRQQDSLRLLAPYLGRYQTEFLSPVIEKVFSMMARAGVFGQLPEEIVQAEYEVEYTSPLANLQKATEVQKFAQFLQFAMGVAQVNPGALDVVDFDKVMSNAAEDIGIWKSVLRDPEELEAMRMQQQQMMQMQQMLNAGTQVADMAGKIPQDKPMGV
jgi:hypothetical protein